MLFQDKANPETLFPEKCNNLFYLSGLLMYCSLRFRSGLIRIRQNGYYLCMSVCMYICMYVNVMYVSVIEYIELNMSMFASKRMPAIIAM